LKEKKGREELREDGHIKKGKNKAKVKSGQGNKSTNERGK
jgi:hypothetical protein